MSLKQSIVIVNEYTVKGRNGKGSRGSSPGEYVVRYMARDLATENITPATLHDAESYLVKYGKREDAVDSFDNVSDIKDAMYDAQKLGGIAFGYGDSALSHEKLALVGNDIQLQFDKGKTVMKTVLSFDLDYLRSHGLLDPDFEHEKRGDFRGNLDQLKLRLAIINGVQRMGRRYDNLQFVGVIQVDTDHVHCHLAMVDKGRGRLARDGTQKGKLSAYDMRQLRFGIDTYLDRKQYVRQLSSSVTSDRRNVLCYVKKFTHRTMDRQGFPQFLLACLPSDRRLWRASTNRTEMRKANFLVRDYVLRILEQPGSGYVEANDDIRRYAEYRRDREGLSELEYNKLIRDGQNRIIDSCIDGVYSVMKQIPVSQMNLRTPMLSSMSMDYEDMALQAANDPMVEFGFKLRTYSSRIDHHKKEYHKWRDESRSYESAEDKSSDSKPLGDYLAFEANYNAMLMVKYQYFLSFLPSDEDLEDELEELMEEEEALRNLKRMRNDPSILRMGPEAAEDYGFRVYGQHGGRRVKDQSNVIDNRIRQFEIRVADRLRDFKDKLHDSGLDYDGEKIVRSKMFAFDDVKALDLHHLGYDFPYDIRVSSVNIDRFKTVADQRYRLFLDAKDYLIASGQELAVKELPERDVVFMKEFADRLSDQNSITSIRSQGGYGRKHSGYTIRLGDDYVSDIDNIIRSTVYDVQSDIDRNSV